jgi:DNA excision repair protein ERCC-2
LHENKSLLSGFAKRLSHELHNITGGETRITQEFLDKKIMQALQGGLGPYKNRDDILEELETTSRDLLERNPMNSAPLQLFSFLTAWGTPGNSVFRSYKPDPPTITIGMLDPALYTQEVFSRVSGAVLMSGTLHPGEMYADLLGIDNPCIQSYSSSFPRVNRQIVSDGYLTTRYEERTSKMFQGYAHAICNLARVVPGNVAVFFPSYDLIHEVYKHLASLNVGRQIIVEDRAYTKAEKELLVNSLRKSDTHLLMAVQGGSLSEGVDYENNSLSSIIIAGMPFPPPSLELEALQDYYSSKFGKRKGYEYTRVYPALNRVLQAVGRCIRSETDRAFIVLLDKRFNYPKYRQSMPQGFTYHTSVDLIAECDQFFYPHGSS